MDQVILDLGSKPNVTKQTWELMGKLKLQW